MNIPFFDYKILFKEKADDYLSIINSTLSDGAFIMQKELIEFEKNLANFLGVKYAVGVADGTTALVLALKANKIESGDEVIVSSHTFIATASAINSIGAIPVICDSQSDGLIDPNSVEKMITSKTKAIMPTQLNGRICDMEKLLKISDEYNLKIIEDSCQALGAKYKDTFAGMFGLVGSYSFFPAKTLGCFGDGGAIVTNSEETANFIKILRDHGRGKKGKVIAWGDNGRLDNVQAAILNYKLKNYANYIAHRRKLAEIYFQNLISIKEIKLPPNSLSDKSRFDIFQNFEIQAEKRNELKEYLSNNNIGTLIQWGGWMLHHFKDLKMKSSASYAEEYSKRMLLLPMNHFLKENQVEFICEKIKNFYS